MKRKTKHIIIGVITNLILAIIGIVILLPCLVIALVIILFGFKDTAHSFAEFPLFLMFHTLDN